MQRPGHGFEKGAQTAVASLVYIVAMIGAVTEKPVDMQSQEPFHLVVAPVGPQNPLTAALSKDEGETWELIRNIEDASDDAWAYPAVTWIKDHAFLTYFNYQGGLSLQLKILPADWFYKQVECS